MSVRVVARIRPLLKAEIEKDIIVHAVGAPGDAADGNKSVVRIPNPKNDAELYSFQFSNVYDHTATQAEIFDSEVSPTVKHLFKGFDVTLFAYGVTGTGKTHTMRGGKSLAERGVIPRLLSSIYRRARKVEKDSDGETEVEVVMSYYEIYNDRVYDLFEPPEKRTPAGLPIRDNQSGKAIVVGLTERPCTTLKEFEQLYDQANVNRSTSATKLNAHSSRSHAVLCVKVTQTTGDEVRVSTASAIDLAGSEDNRRTENNKDRMVESASINKSLFVLASCVEAISKKHSRIPYRESKMTRILALGQNNGLTVMILNLAPVRSYHLDTLSSLNFANRTKKIEVNEIENQPFFREPQGKSKQDNSAAGVLSATALLNRQPLRSKILSQNSHLKDVATNVPKPVKQFAVFTDKPKPAPKPPQLANTSQARTTTSALKSPKRTNEDAAHSLPRPSKISKPNQSRVPDDALDALIERKVAEALAERAGHKAESTQDAISSEVQKRLEALEKRVEGQETERSEGLRYMLMAKQHQARGEDASALTMYQLALPYFPGNDKLTRKIVKIQDKLAAKRAERHASTEPTPTVPRRKPKPTDDDGDETYHGDASPPEEPNPEEEEDDDDGPLPPRPRTKLRRRPHMANLSRDTNPAPIPAPPQTQRATSPPPDDSEDELATALMSATPRTKQLLHIINTKDVSQIKLLKGVGARKAEAIVNCLCDLEEGGGGGGGEGGGEGDGGVKGAGRRKLVTSLVQLGKLKGVGVRTVENMRLGLCEF